MNQFKSYKDVLRDLCHGYAIPTVGKAKAIHEIDPELAIKLHEAYLICISDSMNNLTDKDIEDVCTNLVNNVLKKKD